MVRPRRRLRAGFTQLIAIGVGVTLGLTLPRIDAGAQVPSARAVDILGFVGISVVGVAGLIFSLLFLVAQWAAANFSPRLTLFRTDPMVWRTFAFIIGLLGFALCATLAIGDRPTTSVVVPVVTAVLAVAALAMARNLQLRAFEAIQLAHVLGVTAERAHRIVEAFFTPDVDAAAQRRTHDADADPDPDADRPRLPPVRSTATWQGWTTTVQQLDIPRLVDAAKGAGAVVEMTVRVGTTVQNGDPVARIRGADLAVGEVMAGIVAGRERTFHQDPEFAFRLLADIALRALSPAVNDPATAVQVLDALDGLLRRLATAPLDRRSITDERAAVRLILCLPTWLDFVRISLDDLCNAALGSPMVLLRARRLLTGLVDLAPAGRRGPVASRLAWIDSELTARYPAALSETDGYEEAADGTPPRPT